MLLARNVTGLPDVTGLPGYGVTGLARYRIMNQRMKCVRLTNLFENLRVIILGIRAEWGTIQRDGVTMRRFSSPMAVGPFVSVSEWF
jgi:hypothetical protein